MPPLAIPSRILTSSERPYGTSAVSLASRQAAWCCKSVIYLPSSCLLSYSLASCLMSLRSCCNLLLRLSKLAGANRNSVLRPATYWSLWSEWMWVSNCLLALISWDQGSATKDSLCRQRMWLCPSESRVSEGFICGKSYGLSFNVKGGLTDIALWAEPKDSEPA